MLNHMSRGHNGTIRQNTSTLSHWDNMCTNKPSNQYTILDQYAMPVNFERITKIKRCLSSGTRINYDLQKIWCRNQTQE